jgi:WD40 repeat protein
VPPYSIKDPVTGEEIALPSHRSDSSTRKYFLKDPSTGQRLSLPIPSADGSRMAYGVGDGTVRICEGRPDRIVATVYKAKDKDFLALSALDWMPLGAFSPDGAVLATTRGNEPIKLWKQPTFSELRTLEYAGVVDCMLFSPGGRYLATVAWQGKGSGRNILAVWEVATGKRLVFEQRDEDGGDEFVSPEFTSNGRTLTATLRSKDGRSTTLQWDTENGARLN